MKLRYSSCHVRLRCSLTGSQFLLYSLCILVCFSLHFFFCLFGVLVALGFELSVPRLQSRRVALLLEPHLQFILLWLFWRWDLLSYLPRLASNCNPPDLSLPSNWCESLVPFRLRFAVRYAEDLGASGLLKRGSRRTWSWSQDMGQRRGWSLSLL
jgi:hypothetical protein